MFLISSRKSGEYPTSSVERAGPHPALPLQMRCHLPQLSTTTGCSCPESSSDPAPPHNKTSSSGTQNTLPSQAIRPPHLPDSVKYLHYSQALWAPQQRPWLLSSFLLHPFQAAFSNRTPTKTILHKLQQPFVEIPRKPHHNPAADFWLSTEPLYLNTRENTSARH